MHVLSKMIKKSTGFNFKELLQRKRLNKAVELMCETDLPVSDIIAAVGYENNSYFHRVFKEHYHMTPRAFRVKNSEKEQVRLVTASPVFLNIMELSDLVFDPLHFVIHIDHSAGRSSAAHC